MSIDEEECPSTSISSLASASQTSQAPSLSKSKKRKCAEVDFGQELLKRFDSMNQEDRLDSFGAEVARDIRSIKGELEQELVIREIRDVIFRAKFTRSAHAAHTEELNG